jgi:hypothetical protein
VLGDLAKGMAGFHFDLIPFLCLVRKKILFSRESVDKKKKKENKKYIYTIFCVINITHKVVHTFMIHC